MTSMLNLLSAESESVRHVEFCGGASDDEDSRATLKWFEFSRSHVIFVHWSLSMSPTVRSIQPSHDEAVPDMNHALSRVGFTQRISSR